MSDEKREPGLPEKENLRDRIAAAIKQADEAVHEDGADPFLQFRPASYDDLADAVIRELQIEVEDGECNYCRAMLPGCRYSCWKTNHE